MLVTERKVSASTHNQALSALLFLYREVLEEDLQWLTNINRPAQVRRIPSVLTKDEVAGLLAAREGVTALLARLLYGSGTRLMEGIATLPPCLIGTQACSGAHSGRASLRSLVTPNA